MRRRAFFGAFASVFALPALAMLPKPQDDDVLRPYSQTIIIDQGRRPGTDFARLTDEQKEIWAKALWKEARASKFLEKFGENLR